MRHPKIFAAPITDRKVQIAVVIFLSSVLWTQNGIWLSRDTQPPAWDMALHQGYALNYLPNAQLPANVQFWELSGNYPPFVHILIAVAYWLIHPGPHVAILANIPATLLLLWGVFEMGRQLAGTRAAIWACVLTTLTPFLIWISRETLLDYWLSAWIATALAILLKMSISDSAPRPNHRRKKRGAPTPKMCGFESRWYSILFGFALAAGMLTKWLFAGLIIAPVVYVIIRSEIWSSKRRAINCVIAIAIAAIGAGVWYLPNLPKLIRYYLENSQIGAREGEPPVISFQSFVYYLRLLEGYQFFAVLFCLFVLSIVFIYKIHAMKNGGFLVAAIAGGWLAMTLLRTKDPRFTMPLLGPMTVVIGAWVQFWKRGWRSSIIKTVLVILLSIQAYAISFGLPWLPQQIVLLQGYQGQLRWDWNLYLQHYFDVFGPPKREDWKQETILRRVATESAQRQVPASLALIPDIPRFNAINFNLFASIRGLSIQAARPQSLNGIYSFGGFNYVILTEGDQGWAYTTMENLKLNEIVLSHPEIFHVLDSYLLPNGVVARLYVIQ